MTKYDARHGGPYDRGGRTGRGDAMNRKQEELGLEETKG